MRSQTGLYILLATITGLTALAILSSISYPPLLFGAVVGIWAGYKLALHIERTKPQ
jgi:hypothetical protein